MIKSVLLGCMLFNSPLFFSFFESNLSLNFKKILISLFKFLSGFSSSLLSLKIAHSFSFKLFLDLSLYKFALKLFFFHLLNVIQFEIFKLCLDVLSILHLFVILLLKFFPQTLIILKHFLSLKFFPLQIDFPVELLFFLLMSLLDYLFRCNIAQKHFTMQCLNHILVVVEHFICLVQLFLSLLLLICLLFCINSSSFDLLQKMRYKSYNRNYN